MVSSEAMSELQAICPGARLMTDGGVTFILLPGLRLPAGCTPSQSDGLLAIQQRDGYPTKLYLSAPIQGKGNNWNVFPILDRTWHSWSWKDVVYSGRPVDTLAQHLVALR